MRQGIYNSSSGIILEIRATGEVLFNGTPCKVEPVKNNKYAVCLEDWSVDIVVNGNTFVICNAYEDIKRVEAPRLNPPPHLKSVPVSKAPSNNEAESKKPSSIEIKTVPSESKKELLIPHKTDLITLDDAELKIKLRVDAVYLINLPRRTDRYKNCIKQLKYITKQFYKVTPLLITEKGWFNNVNEKSCYLSHHWCMFHAKQNNFKRVLILEDDFIMREAFFKDYDVIENECVSKKYDVLFPYTHIGVKIPHTEDTLIAYNVKTWLAHFYIINNLNKILEWNEIDYKPGVTTVDQTYACQPALDTIITKKTYVIQDYTFSDLANGYIDRTEKFDDLLLSINGGDNHIYQKIEGWFDFQDIYSLAIERYDNAHFVEIGCWKGKSAAYMAVEIKKSKKKIKFDCVDTWLGSEEHKNDPDIIKYKDIFSVFKNNISSVSDYINPIQMDSREAAKLYEDNSLDLIFIDASHDYENVKKDLLAWHPKLKSTGIIAGHDIGWSGVNKAVSEHFKSFKIMTGSWIVGL